MAFFKPVVLKGDYAGSGSTGRERQNRAKLEGCVCTVDFHFNSAADSGARGGEVHYQNGVKESRQFAEVMWAELASIGLPAHGSITVKSTAQATRSTFIDYYQTPAILIEPLFISNPDQARFLHGPNADENTGRLADAIAAAIKGQFPNGGKIGLSPGHAFKTSSPNDPGSPCALSDTERDHILALVALVERRLS